ncbi:hypothetical protein PFICI_01780 [Pestalotiopsis fici W106-1]|uniref:C3H1-type domain-containing protein n=1 Tax=Pestalotiopsis fici (strain W106-1 / CGMCC3.15140) TaxID=1229662 RepID=W3XR08_PESFW|nr:uncharacterized protein PFICI_01780 [Pestalotiopsis fici W106-1]ETS87952.1 hypothetical protein PFICI_01780 [Pestalotiopsis fici W106-1]
MASKIEQGRDHEENRNRAMMEPTSESSSLTGQLPRYFLVRPDVTKHTASGTVTTKGAMVPLIPIDQLPSWLEITGVPRELSPEHMKGLTNLGESTKDFDTYNVCVIYHDDDGDDDDDDDDDDGASEPRMTSRLDKIKYQHVGASSGRHIITTAHCGNDSNPRGHSQRTPQHHGSDIISTAPGELDANTGKQGTGHDDMLGSDSSRQDDSSYDHPASSASSEACESVLSSSPDKETFPSLRVKEGIQESRHAPRTTNTPSLVTRKQIPPSPTADLNPRIPSSVPARPRELYNPYSTLTRKRTVPSGDQQAYRLKKSLPSSSRYSPSQPSRSLAISHHRGGNGNGSNNVSTSGSSRYDVLGYSTTGGSTTNHQHHPTNNNNNNTRTSSSAGTGSSTTYCRHWCHHNTCKYGAECKYVHEMPKTLEGLSAVGLSDWPKWYKAEKHGYEKAMAEVHQSLNLNGTLRYPAGLVLVGPHSSSSSSSRAPPLTEQPEKQEIAELTEPQHHHQHQQRQSLERHMMTMMEEAKRASKMTKDKKRIKGPSSYSTSSKKLSAHRNGNALLMRQRSHAGENPVRDENGTEGVKMARAKADKMCKVVASEEEQDLISLD